MSRFAKTLDNGQVAAYGFDNALGYFFDVFNEDDEPIIEESSFMTDLNHGRMLELMTNYNVGSEEQRQKVALDLPF